MNRRSFLVTGAKLLALGSPAVAVLSGKRVPTSATPIPDGWVQAAVQLPPLAAHPEQAPPPRELPWSLPAQAVELALLNARDLAAKYGDGIGSFYRWLWVQSGDGDEWRATADALNKVSRAAAPIIPPLAGGILLGVDLRAYWPRKQDLLEVLELWEQFAFDPYFSLLFTAGSLKAMTHEHLAQLKTQSFRQEHVWDATAGVWQATGKKAWVERSFEKIKGVVVERINAPHLRGSGIEKLQAWTGSLAPVVHAGYFLSRALSTIKDRDNGKENPFSTIYGGLYNELAGVRKSSVKGRSDLDQLFLDLGVGSGSETYRQIFDRLRSDKAAILIHSNVTNKRRRVRVYPVLSSLFGIVAVTEDVRNRDIDVDADALRDVLNSKVFAYEVIWVAANGQQKYALYGAEGQLLEKGADDVVSDHTLPSPVTTELQAAISCIRCHGPYDGWQPFKDDFQKLLQRSTIFSFGSDEADRVRGQHTFDIDGTLARLRDDYSRSVLLSTGPWPKSQAQKDVAVKAAAKQAEMWARQRYRTVDAEYALRTLGQLPVKGKEAVQLSLLLPPEGNAALGFYREDPLLIALKDGDKILWNDYQLLYGYALTRVLQTKGNGR